MSPHVRRATEDDLTIVQSIASLSWAQAYNELIPSSVQKNI
ncbi:hypothetical protein [Gracilibacillus phocaeensis]|nr:hypothetical protein [Gracilibacillus phocaeensis]